MDAKFAGDVCLVEFHRLYRNMQLLCNLLRGLTIREQDKDFSLAVCEIAGITFRPYPVVLYRSCISASIFGERKRLLTRALSIAARKSSDADCFRT